MRARGLLVAFLLAPGLCLVPSAGYGTISNELIEGKTLVRHGLLRARAPLILYLLWEATRDYMDTQDSDSEKYVWVFMCYDEDGTLSVREIESVEKFLRNYRGKAIGKSF